MKHLTLAVLAALMLVAGADARDWTDNGDGTSTASVTVQTTTTDEADPVLDAIEIEAHASWSDTGAGSWQLAVALTAPTTGAKSMAEQIRADHNYTYRTSADALSATSWASGALAGFEVTQTGKSGTVTGLVGALAPAFKRRYLTEQVREGCWGTADNCATEALAVTVPSPPAP